MASEKVGGGVGCCSASMRREPTGNRERTSGDSRRDGTFLPIVATAGIIGAALAAWHGWASVGALAPFAGAIWFAGIVAVALGFGVTADLDAAATRRRQWRP